MWKTQINNMSDKPIIHNTASKLITTRYSLLGTAKLCQRPFLPFALRGVATASTGNAVKGSLPRS